MKRLSALCLLGVLFGVSAVRSDEGLWTFDGLPADKLRKTYGFVPDAAWLDHVRMASVRLPGCSAGVVSRHGLVLTKPPLRARLYPGSFRLGPGPENDELKEP